MLLELPEPGRVDSGSRFNRGPRDIAVQESLDELHLPPPTRPSRRPSRSPFRMASCYLTSRRSRASPPSPRSSALHLPPPAAVRRPRSAAIASPPASWSQCTRRAAARPRLSPRPQLCRQRINRRRIGQLFRYAASSACCAYDRAGRRAAARPPPGLVDQQMRVTLHTGRMSGPPIRRRQPSLPRPPLRAHDKLTPTIDPSGPTRQNSALPCPKCAIPYQKSRRHG